MPRTTSISSFQNETGRLRLARWLLCPAILIAISASGRVFAAEAAEGPAVVVQQLDERDAIIRQLIERVDGLERELRRLQSQTPADVSSGAASARSKKILRDEELDQITGAGEAEGTSLAATTQPPSKPAAASP